MTPREAAKRTGYTHQHLTYLIRKGKVKARKKPIPGGFVYDVTPAEVAKLKKEGRDNRGRKANA